MNDMLVAQCPHCQTRFRLSQEHLQAAGGNVRCGACLKVFDASAQIPVADAAGNSTSSLVKNAAPAAAAESTISRQGTLLIHDDLELDDLDLEALGLDESILDEINPDARTVHSGSDPIDGEPAADATPEEHPIASGGSENGPAAPDQPAPTELHDEFPIEHSDEEWEQPGDVELSSAPPQDAAQTGVEPPVEQHPRPDPLSNWTPTDAEIDRAFEFDSARDKPDTWDLDFNLDNDLAEKPAYVDDNADDLDDIELHEAFRNAASSRDFAPRPAPPEPTPDDDSKPNPFAMSTSTPLQPRTTTSDEDSIFLRDQPFLLPSAEPGIRAPRREPAPAPAPAPASKPGRQERLEPSLDDADRDDNNLLLPDLVDEPLYLDDRPRARKPRLQWLWALLSIAAALALLGQVAVYNYTALAHNERIRPIMEQLCFVAGCELPARVDIELVRSSNLVVRPHPDFPNALAIDVILYNRADFAQPFPVLRMTFSDLGGRELSTKLFQPTEYLGGELAGGTLMPPQTPVHVGLSMLDPGTEVASYNLDFLSP